MTDNQELTEEGLDLESSYVESTKLSNKMNVTVTLHKGGIMNGSILSYVANCKEGQLTNQPYTMKQYEQSEAAQENLFKLLKEASISGKEEATD